FRRTVTIGIAVACLAIGFTLGVYRDPIVHSFRAAVGLSAGGQTADAAYSSYQRADYTAAFRRASRLAMDGDPRRESLLGLLSCRGRGAAQAHAEAIRWFRRAADNGDAAAEFYLGVMFAEGQGVPQDYTEAVTWYRRAAARGDAQAQYNLGLAY